MLLIFPWSMRESINYAIRARLRGERIIGASSEPCGNLEYCDAFIHLPSIFSAGFEEEIRKLDNISRFYTPHHLVYQYVKSLNLPFEFAEGNPIEIMEAEFRAMPSAPVVQTSRIYGHMSEEKLGGIIKCFSMTYDGDVFEVGHAWGKSLKALCMYAKGKVYAIDTCDREIARQSSSHQIVKDSVDAIDWKLMGAICRANVPEAIYEVPTSPLSVLHIDANHDYENVKADWEAYGHLLIPGGWLILDDIDWPGVAKLWWEISGGFSQIYEAGGALFAKKI